MSRLQEIEERAEKATAGLEYARYDHGGGRAFHNGRTLVLDCYDEDNREFYFNAREDVPWLVARLKRAKKLLGRVDNLHTDRRTHLEESVRDFLKEDA